MNTTADTPSSQTRYWGVLANDRVYDIYGSMSELKEVGWAAPKANPSPGDKLVIWKTLGADGRRGIFGFADVLEFARIQDPSADSLRFCRSAELKQRSRRVKIRYNQPEGFPIFADEHPEILDFKLARCQGIAFFSLTAEEYAYARGLEAEPISRLAPTADEPGYAAIRSEFWSGLERWRLAQDPQWTPQLRVSAGNAIVEHPDLGPACIKTAFFTSGTRRVSVSIWVPNTHSEFAEQLRAWGVQFGDVLGGLTMAEYMGVEGNWWYGTRYVFDTHDASLYAQAYEFIADCTDAIIELFAPRIQLLLATESLPQATRDDIRNVTLVQASNDDPTETQVVRLRRRSGQPRFRKNMLRLYGDQCAITGFSPPAVLQAAHISGHAECGNNHSDNGLLLRADLHGLFDAGLLRIHPDTKTVIMDDSLRDGPYWALNGQPLRKRVTAPDYPKTEYLQRKFEAHRDE